MKKIKNKNKNRYSPENIDFDIRDYFTSDYGFEDYDSTHSSYLNSFCEPKHYEIENLNTSSAVVLSEDNEIYDILERKYVNERYIEHYNPEVMNFIDIENEDYKPENKKTEFEKIIEEILFIFKIKKDLDLAG